MDEVLGTRISIGPMINSKLEPIIVRAQTRKNRPLNVNQNKRNMNTLKGLSRLLDKAKNKNNPNFQQKREWLTKLTRAMNEQYTFNNLEQAFLGPPILKIEAPTRKKQITAHPLLPHPSSFFFLLPSPFPPNGLLQHQRSSPAR
jgi:hypothetical protein